MSKKRRTKSQKIIANLRRQLEEKPTITHDSPVILPKNITPLKEVKKRKERETRPLLISASLIKKDLKKTLFLGLIFILGIFLIKQFFHL